MLYMERNNNKVNLIMPSFTSNTLNSKGLISFLPPHDHRHLNEGTEQLIVNYFIKTISLFLLHIAAPWSAMQYN